MGVNPTEKNPHPSRNNVKTESDCEDSGLKDAYKLLLKSDSKTFFTHLKFVTQLTVAVSLFEVVGAAQKIEDGVNSELEKAKNLCNQVRDEVKFAAKHAMQTFSLWSKNNPQEKVADDSLADTIANQESETKTTVATPSI